VMPAMVKIRFLLHFFFLTILSTVVDYFIISFSQLIGLQALKKVEVKFRANRQKGKNPAIGPELSKGPKDSLGESFGLNTKPQRS